MKHFFVASPLLVAVTMLLTTFDAHAQGGTSAVPFLLISADYSSRSNQAQPIGVWNL